MLDFEFYSPTKIVFGKNAEKNVADQIKAFGGSKVLVHFGGNSAQKSGLLGRLLGYLEEAGIEFVQLGGVVPNPRLSLVRQGISLCKKEKIDFILAIGGGSVIDSAKAIGIGAAGNCDVWDYYEGTAVPEACLPVGVVLTIAAAGSESSDGSVLTNEDGLLKWDCGANCMRPKFAILNPELTYTLPSYQTACGITDILMHTMERYFTTVPAVELGDTLCEGLMRVVMRNGKIVMERPNDYDARVEIMWAGNICHNGLLSSGRRGDWASHQLEVELSGMFDVAHGAGLAAIWGSWARYVYRTDTARFARFAVEVMGCTMDYHSPDRTAQEGIAAMECYLRSIGMPTSISQLGVHLTEEEIRELAHKCSRFGAWTIGGFQVLNEEDMAEIYRMAR